MTTSRSTYDRDTAEIDAIHALGVRARYQPGCAHAAPLIIEPDGDRRAAHLAEVVRAHRGVFDDALLQVGALLFRGFQVPDPATFEDVAGALSPDLRDDYLGTSPRNSLTRFVFTASELPPHYPIPQHCEMSFTRRPPTRLYFHCMTAPRVGGETPVCDFRAVARDLPDAVRETFETRGLRVIRNYAPPQQTRRFDPWQLKPWVDMFGTEDRDQVDEICAEQGFETRWSDAGQLTIISYQDAFLDHPVTGTRAWFNHAQVFHLSTGAAEYRRILGRRPGITALGMVAFTSAATAYKAVTCPPEARALHCQFGDGGEIEADVMEAVRDTIWRHLVAIPWQHGDILGLDNLSVSHGRLPYRGPRLVTVAWAGALDRPLSATHN